MLKIETLISKAKGLRLKLGGSLDPLRNSFASAYSVVDQKSSEDSFKMNIIDIKNDMTSIEEIAKKRKQIVKTSGYHCLERISNPDIALMQVRD